MHPPRSRVFISCGQAENTDERRIADEIARKLEELGFDPFVAFRVQSLRGLKENIFAQLSVSEYLVFVDFRRDRLGDTGEYRGSLFSHQELAIGAFLDIDVAAFHEKGVTREGIAAFVQANSVQFGDRDHLPAVIAQHIRGAGWQSNWRRELTIELPEPRFMDATRVERDQFDSVAQFVARFFHVAVRNLDVRRPALNCYVYLEKVRELSSGKEDNPPTIEFKWAGYGLPNAIIGPASARRFDALWIMHNDLSRIRFNSFADATPFQPPALGEGVYELKYRVVSENFPSVSSTLRWTLGDNLEQSRLEMMG
jgi:hypothetical protein